MRSLALLLISVALGNVAGAPVHVASLEVADITTAGNWGIWDGWGVSLCWWANIFGQRDDLADLVFTRKMVTIGGIELPGLGLNIARYNAGGSSPECYKGACMSVSPSIPHWKQIQGFWWDWGSDEPSSSSWNWTADANQVAMLKKAKARGANQLELFSNSPMWWMLGDRNPSGSTGGGDNLTPWNYGNHSKYLATVAEHAKENWGIDFDAVEPFNEPFSKWWTSGHTQEGCHFDRSTQAMGVNHLRAELDKRGLKAIVSASDENQYDEGRDTWNSFDHNTRSKIGRVNVHGYQGAGGRRDLLYRDLAGKPLWNSETGDGDASGMSMAYHLNLDFYWLHSTAYVYWQMLDETDGWGLLKMDPDRREVQYPNAKYWVFAQYTRHIRPGMVIMKSEDVNTVVAWDAKDLRLVLVKTNFETPLSMTYDLSKWLAAGQNTKSVGTVTRWVTQTSEGGDRYVRYHDTKITNGRLTVHCPTNTVQSIEIENFKATQLFV